MPITLYQVDWCHECHEVRDKLADLGLSYENIIVPDVRRLRTQVHKVSGQYYVPVLQDGDLILTETADILAYLDERYGTEGAGTGSQFQSQARATPDTPGEDDEHPSCRVS